MQRLKSSDGKAAQKATVSEKACLVRRCVFQLAVADECLDLYILTDGEKLRNELKKLLLFITMSKKFRILTVETLTTHSFAVNITLHQVMQLLKSSDGKAAQKATVSKKVIYHLKEAD
ncbi:hypothetical protein CEXT_107501 [Caerostris extrusa]|uniref:Uncharacterized protein n=1 Tax=Caerostris extrusa TaxID=172846 RepID=A0AAV4XDQ5_CAEEX|nr:hypothetical protein CEXT_107501 [Caerostris extrusa]